MLSFLAQRQFDPLAELGGGVRRAVRDLPFVVELAPQAEGSEERRQTATASILHHLMRLNSEFANYVPPEYRTPRVELRPNGDPEYFPAGVKHRYTRR